LARERLSREKRLKKTKKVEDFRKTHSATSGDVKVIDRLDDSLLSNPVSDIVKF